MELVATAIVGCFCQAHLYLWKGNGMLGGEGEVVDMTQGSCGRCWRLCCEHWQAKVTETLL